MMTEENNWVVHQSFRTTEAEDELIRQKMKVFGIRKKSLLFRAMVLNGYLLKLDLPEIRELIRLMKNLTNNVNQIAKTLHEHGSIYGNDTHHSHAHQQRQNDCAMHEGTDEYDRYDLSDAVSCAWLYTRRRDQCEPGSGGAF